MLRMSCCWMRWIRGLKISDLIQEWRDFKTGAWRRDSKTHVAMQPEFDMNAVVSGGAASLSYDGYPIPALSVDRFFMMHIGPNPWYGYYRHSGRFSSDHDTDLPLSTTIPTNQFVAAGASTWHAIQ